METADKQAVLAKLGFKFGRGGAHIARTMMLAELQTLLACLPDPGTSREQFREAIVNGNCLEKRTMKTRALSFEHLSDMYALSPDVLIFRALRWFWERDPSSQPLLALLCMSARDAVFRSVLPFVLEVPEGAVVRTADTAEFLDSLEPGRFSRATLTSIAQNINSSLTKSGHLAGISPKTRRRAVPGPGSVSFSLLLGYLTGARGPSLFQTGYSRMLDCEYGKALELAEESSRRGWIVLRRIADIIEVLFPKQISQEETEWLREQN